MSGRFDERTVKRLPMLVATVVLGLVAGCIVHGDYIHLCKLEGTVLDADSNAPLPDASVFITTRESAVWNRGRMEHTTTDAQGAFSTEITIGGGSVTWIVVFPVTRGDKTPPNVRRLFVEIEHGARMGRVELDIPEGAQKRIDAGRSAINLGDFTVELGASPAPTAGRG